MKPDLPQIRGPIALLIACACQRAGVAAPGPGSSECASSFPAIRRAEQRSFVSTTAGPVM